MKYARVENATVVELIELPDSLEIADAFHPDIATTFVLCDDAGVEQGWTFDGKAFALPAESIRPLAEVKAELKSGVDAAAESERLKYITPGNGQAMTYQQKVTEAQAFKAAIDPQPEDFPMLSSEVGITAPTIDEVADVVLAAYAQWQQIGAAIEVIRLGAKRDIDAAEDEAAARAIINAIEWPQPAL